MVKVHEQEKTFYLAADGWIPMAGHEITIGKHRFCATPNGDALQNVIIISEVTSGAKLTAIKLDFFDLIVMDDKSKYMEFLRLKARKLADLLSARKDLDDQIEKMKLLAISKFGPKPPTEIIDFEEELDRMAQ